MSGNAKSDGPPGRLFTRLKSRIRRRARLLGFFAPEIVVAVSALTTCWYAVMRGQDLNWDQQNYHFSVPALLFNGTYWDSIAPAGIQSYFNPVYNCIQFLAITHLHAVNFAILLGLLQSLAFVTAGLICIAIVRNENIVSRAPENVWLGLLGFGLCLASPVALSEAGTTMSDLAISIPLIFAYGLLLTRKQTLGRPALAGLLAGIATGLKLSNAPMALGAIGFALAGPENVWARLRWLTAYCAVAIFGFAVISGYWQWLLWERFHNPFFPYYNNIFRSPDTDLSTLRDARFLARSVLDFWAYPYYWLVAGNPGLGNGSASAELSFRDIRWIILVVGGPAFVVALFARPQWARKILSEPATGLLFAVMLGYVIWLAEFGIHRYMLTADILCGAAILFLFLQIPARTPRFICLALVSASALSLCTAPDWGHVPYEKMWRTIKPVAGMSSSPSLVILTDGTPYIAATLPATWRYARINGGLDLGKTSNTSLASQLRAQISDQNLNLKIAYKRSLELPDRQLLEGYRLVATSRCRAIALTDEPVQLCDLERSP